MTETTKSQVVSDLKLVLDITSRVDERVKMIAESQAELTHRLNRFVDEHNSLATRVKLLETNAGEKLVADIADVRDKIDRMRVRTDLLETIGAAPMRETITNITKEQSDFKNRLEKVETTHSGVTERAKQVAGLFFQGIWVIIVCYVLYKLGINGTPSGL